MAINKADIIKKIALGADISIAEATRSLQSFESAIKPKSYEDEVKMDNSHAWRSGSRKKGNKFRYERN